MAPCPPLRGLHVRQCTCGLGLAGFSRWQVLCSHTSLCCPWPPKRPGASWHLARCLVGLGVWGQCTATPLFPMPSLQQQPRRCGHAAGLHRGRDGGEVDDAPRWRAARDGRVQVSGAPRPWEETAPLPGSPEPTAPAPGHQTAEPKCLSLLPHGAEAERFQKGLDLTCRRGMPSVLGGSCPCVLRGGICPEHAVPSRSASISVGSQNLPEFLKVGVFETRVRVVSSWSPERQPSVGEPGPPSQQRSSGWRTCSPGPASLGLRAEERFPRASSRNQIKLPVAWRGGGRKQETG